MTMRLRRLAALGQSLVLFVSCGGSSSSDSSSDTTAEKGSSKEATKITSKSSGSASERKKLAASFKEGFQGSSDIPISDEEADCAAGGIIDALGAKRVAELDKSDTLSMTAPEAKKVIPVIKKCLDIGALFTQGILEGGAGSVSEKSAKCLSDALSKTTFIDSALEAAFTGGVAPDIASDPAFSSTMLNAMTTCLTPEEIKKASGG